MTAESNWGFELRLFLLAKGRFLWHTKKMAMAGIQVFIQVLVILIFSRFCAVLSKKIGQPQVIGEMIAGILLGKSVLGLLWPEGFTILFPLNLMPNLYFLSQLGLVLFMFFVGLELKTSELKNRAMAAILISHASIALPFLLGVLLALVIHGQYGPEEFSLLSFALFMGIAMSITAFPVLARILQEKKLTETPLGVMALTCAAVDDVTAWCLLAAVIGIAKAGTILSALGILTASFVYILVMSKIVKPWIGKIKKGQLILVLGTLLGSALTTELIGIHALFGAFFAGAIMPQDFLARSDFLKKLKEFSALVLLPVFFAYTGIRMQIGLLGVGNSWLVCGVIVFLAIFGKMVGSALAARVAGISWRESWALGTLMNTRGLMELVVLNIGYDLGILSPTIFAMMVIMAFVTTAMTGPLLDYLVRSPTNRSAP